MPDYRSRQERRQSQAKKQNKGNGNKGLWKKIVLALCVFVGLCIVGGGIAVFAIVKSAPPLNPKLLSSPISSIIYDKDGKKVT
ncbi:MAG TPA: hypothetical protein VFK37_04830, partial [Bacillales bacterium]|nr:hypothetical protein [Bacillales bacterium]